MANLNARLKIKTDLASNWSTSNPLLLAGELALESDTKKIKIGDGVTRWNSLGYWGAGGGGTSNYNDLENSPIINVTELPSASSALSLIYNLSGVYYISNGTAWEQVAPLPESLIFGEGSTGAVVLPETIDADKLGGQLPSYYLNYNNLSNKPATPTYATLTLKKNSNLLGTYNTSSATEINITTPSVHYFSAEVPATGWSSSAPYTVDVIIDGLLETDKPLVIPTYTGDVSTVASQIKAWSCITRMTANNGTLTMYAYTKAPTIAVPIQLQVIREG